ncbi:MAG: hypothetical protein IPN74_15385 [Haliscomenobacter sp.]|nr:hypothetical protein [Haliscomenobacter sp.]MBK8879861.1 hypothetical protein [Haliscomenobacter sp.]
MVLFLLAIFASSCVSKKTLQETATRYEGELAALRDQLYAAQKEIGSLNLHLAERRGANSALTEVQDKLQSRIDALEKELQKNSSQAQTQEKSLNYRIASKDSLIEAQQTAIEAVREAIRESAREMDAFAGVLRDSFQRHPAGQWEVQLLEGQAVLILSEPLLFKSGVTAKVEPLGLAALKTLADILAQYPSLFVDVVGHHDNQPLPRKVLADVWDYTTLRANTVVRTMVRDMELSPGRVLAAGKGPFAPRQSNETATGQAANRRVEFVIFPSANALPKKILELLSQ